MLYIMGKQKLRAHGSLTLRFSCRGWGGVGAREMQGKVHANVMGSFSNNIPSCCLCEGSAGSRSAYLGTLEGGGSTPRSTPPPTLRVWPTPMGTTSQYIVGHVLRLVFAGRCFRRCCICRLFGSVCLSRMTCVCLCVGVCMRLSPL